MGETKKEKKSLHPFVLMVAIIFAMSILTYVLPAGQYERVEKDGRTLVNPESYETVASNPIDAIGVISSFHLGLVKGAEIILFVFLFGGALGMMKKTGAIDAFIQKMAAKFGKREMILLPLLVFVFAVLGSLIGAAEDSLVYIAIVVPLMITLRMDALTAFATVMLGVMATGFASGITNPFNTAIAQTIAELPMYSGMWLRIVAFIVFYIITVSYIVIHARKVKKDPSKGVFGKFNREDQFEVDLNYKMDTRHLIALLVLLANFGLLIYGVMKYQWYISVIGGLFLVTAIIMCFICSLKLGEMGDSFVDGAKDMVSGALIIGFAQAILVISENAQIIDPILHFIVGLIGNLPSWLNAVGMLFIQMVMNFLVPSGSGQAALTMPIMAPLADMIGVTRQTAVLAFQLGDGISNMIFPTSGVLMAGLAIAGIPYTKWLKWIWPYCLIMTIASIILLLIAQFTNYGPF